MNMERRAFAAELRAKGRRLEGYAATFGTETRVADFTETIAPGAFRNSLGKDVIALVDHDASRVLARTKSKTLRLAEDGKGLQFDLDLPDTSYARDVLELVTRGDAGGMSFAFIPIDEMWDGDRRELRSVVLVLEEGMKWESIGISPEDSELLASRRFGTEIIARIFRVPLPLLGDISNGSYSNIVELNRMFSTHTLTPWIVRLEKAIERDLLSDEGKRTHVVEIDQDDLLRGDMLTRWQSYRIMREIGGASANEIRGWEKINKRTDPGGDEFLSPMNMQAEQTGAPKSPAN
jgi:HK97 family phage prohead protease